jgi:hypothetical protein
MSCVLVRSLRCVGVSLMDVGLESIPSSRSSCTQPDHFRVNHSSRYPIAAITLSELPWFPCLSTYSPWRLSTNSRPTSSSPHACTFFSSPTTACCQTSSALLSRIAYSPRIVSIPVLSPLPRPSCSEHEIAYAYPTTAAHSQTYLLRYARVVRIRLGLFLLPFCLFVPLAGWQQTTYVRFLVQSHIHPTIDRHLSHQTALFTMKSDIYPPSDMPSSAVLSHGHLGRFCELYYNLIRPYRSQAQETNRKFLAAQ